MRYESHLLAFLHTKADFGNYGTLTNDVTVQGRGVLISKPAICTILRQFHHPPTFTN